MNENPPEKTAPLDRLLDTLCHGSISVEGQFAWGSNYTYLAHVETDGRRLPAVYKPSRGQRPLWDFPEGDLPQREVAAYLTSASLGWDLVPPTVLRPDGPAGGGSLQLYVEADPERHYFTFENEVRQRLRPVALFDILVNNADRKGGHVLLAPDGRLWLIDHGLCFHQDDKLRTVIWDFVDEPIPEPLLDDLSAFRKRLQAEGQLYAEYAQLIESEEISALVRRVDRLLAVRRFPQPGQGRPYPWPLV